MEVRERRIARSAPHGRNRTGRVRDGSAWTSEMEIRAAIAMVARDPRYRVVLSADALTGPTIARLGDDAATVGIVLERRIRHGGGCDLVVRRA